MSDPAAPATPHAQSQYQVRFDTGRAGANALTAADVRLWVDELGTSGTAPDGWTRATRADAARHTAAVLAAQADRGDRVSVAVVAASEYAGEVIRFSVPDLLGAGAIIDALAEAGIDHCSPEAAQVAAAFGSLRRAVAHLSSASVAGRIAKERESGAAQ